MDRLRRWTTSQRLDRGRIGQIVELLKNQRTEGDIEILGRTPRRGPEVRREFTNRQMMEQLLSKDTCPRLFQQHPPLLIEKRPRIKQVARLMISNGQRAGIVVI